jgi:single-strand DNA-binding protein
MSWIPEPKNFNHVTAVGCLSTEPKIFTISEGFVKTIFNIAYNNYRTDAKGQRTKKASFFECQLFGKTAQTAYDHLSKGRRILIDGFMSQDNFEDKDGKPCSRIYINVEHFQFMDAKNKGNVESGNKNEDIVPEEFSDQEGVFDALGAKS